MEPIVNKKEVPRFKESSANGTSASVIRLKLLQKDWVNESMFSFYPALPLPNRPRNGRNNFFVELLWANRDTQHIALLNLVVSPTTTVEQ